jgi:hypothetical protein
MRFLGTNLSSNYDGDPNERRVSMEYMDVVIDLDRSMKWQKGKKKQL